jgi:tetratricopeptide (TPR) repeat protein
LVAIALAAVAAIGMAAFLAKGRIIAELGSLDLARLSTEDKIAIWPILLSMVHRFPWFGIGRGAFLTTFPVFKVDVDHLTWTHAENEWLQAVLDLGIPGGLLLIGSFAWTWVRAAFPRHSSPMRVGLLAGTAALAIHNAVDFSLEVLGIALPFAVVSAILTRSDVRWEVPRWVPQLVGGCALVVGSVGSLAYGGYGAQAEGDRLAAQQDLQRVLSAAREAAAHHPADYLPHAIAGMRLAASHRCAQALPWLLRAMWLKPTEADPHYFTGNCRAALRQDSLAKREYRLAFLLGRTEAISAAIEHYPALTDLLDVAPESAQGLTALGALLADRSRPREASEVLERSWRDYGDLSALARLGDVALQLGETERAIEWSRLLQARDSRWVSSYTVASAAFLRQGDLDAALAELSRGSSQVPGHPDLIFPQVQLLIQHRRYAQARQVIRQLVPLSPHETARMHQLTAAALRAEGRTLDAIAELQAAKDAEPNGLQLYEELADALAEVGQVSEALATLRRAALLPNSPAGVFDARISQLLLQRRKQLERAPAPSYTAE